MCNKTNRKQVHTCQYRRRNHKLKLVSWSIIFRGQSTEEARRFFRGSANSPLRFSTVDESFIAMVCPTVSYPTLFSLYNPSNRPTTRIIAPEISMAPLSFILCRSTFFHWSETSSTEGITLVTNSPNRGKKHMTGGKLLLTMFHRH